MLSGRSTVGVVRVKAEDEEEKHSSCPVVVVVVLFAKGFCPPASSDQAGLDQGFH